MINGWPVSTPYNVFDSNHLFPFHPHEGVDFAIPLNTPVPAIGDGVITTITDEGTKSFGRSIHMRLSDGSEVIYGHLQQFNCHVGQTVHNGDIIGLSGSTGDSTGPHVHLQVMQQGHAVDPMPYIQASGGWVKNAPNFINKGFDAIGDHIGQFVQDALNNLLNVVNSNSSQIVTFAVIICAGGMMIAPLFGASTGKWAGRLTGALLTGVIWRVLVSP